MKVHVNPDLCQGTGLCIETCPEVFELNDEKISTVILNQIPDELQQNCRKAADDCPTNAITVD
jgi:ferredoxin